jgi:hypothetical protein
VSRLTFFFTCAPESGCAHPDCEVVVASSRRMVVGVGMLGLLMGVQIGMLWGLIRVAEAQFFLVRLEMLVCSYQDRDCK